MKRILLFLMASACMVSVMAQVSAGEDYTPTYEKRPFTLSVGVKGGINYSIAGNPSSLDLGMEGNIGFQGGLTVNMHFSDRQQFTEAGNGRWGIQLEALYTQRTLKTDIEDIKMNCYAVPVMAQFYVTPKFFIELGPTFTGVLSTSPKVLSLGSIRDGFHNMYLEKIKGLDVMASLGIGYIHYSGFNASARFNLGNSNLAGNFDTKVSTAELSVGYLFKIIK